MTRVKEVYKTIQRENMIKAGHEKRWLVLLLLCLVISMIIGCAKQPKILSTGEIWLPEDVRTPVAKGYTAPKAMHLGVYECNSDWHFCITKKDYDVLKENYKNIYNAHKRMRSIVEEHNKDIRQLKNIMPSEIKCGAFDFKCRGNKNKGMNQ